MKNDTIFILLLLVLSTNIAHSYPKNNLPDTTIWEYKGVVLKDADSMVFQPLHNINSTWDSLNQTYILNKIPHKVFNLNTYDEVNDTLLMKYGKRGGDYLITKIIDIRNLKNPYLTFLYQRAGIYPNRGNTGWCDSILYGPERRVSVAQDTSKSVQDPDLLLIEFMSSDSANLSTLQNPKESDWNIHPRRGGAKPETKNPAMSIFGGGGYRRGFLETDKDSALSFAEGLRADYTDVGNDDRFERAYIQIPDTFVKKGFIRVRFRVDALRNGNGNVVKDDNDDFYLDDIKINQDDPDIALNSVYIQNPYSMLNLNTKFAVPVYLNLSGINTNPKDSIIVKIMIKHSGEPYFTGNEPYSFEIKLPMDSLSSMTQIPSFRIKDYAKYLKNGKNTFQLWAVIDSEKNNSDESNDTLYHEFDIYLGKTIAYDDPINPTNDIPKFSGDPGMGLFQTLYYSGNDFVEDLKYRQWSVGETGQIGLKFTISETDTVFGYQAYWGSLNQSFEDISFSIYKQSGQPSALLVKGSLIYKYRGFDDFKKDAVWDDYVTYKFIKPIILDPGDYWFAVGGMGELPFQLGATAKRMGLVINTYDSDSLGRGNGTCCGLSSANLLVDKTLKFKSKINNKWYNNNFSESENGRGSGHWANFTPNMGNPANSHLNYTGEIGMEFNTFTRGTFMPMIRLYMDGSHHTWSDVGNETKTSDEIEISPNPATDFIEILVGTRRAVSDQSEIKILNIYGQTVLSVGAIHELPLRVDISVLARGMYFVRIGDRVQKFVKI